VQAAPKDVLKLSDEVIIPTAQQGLRMSDVLSTESGKELIQNMEELRLAQAKMAAILRDEKPNVEVPVDSKVAGDILSLKQQAEQLKKQNAIDKAALSQLQNKPSFDTWLIVLAIVAIIAILVILFLLVYIRRNLTNKMPTWWEDESLSSEISPPEKIEDVIKNLQASYDSDASNVGSTNAVSEKKNSVPAANLREAASQVDAPASKPVVSETVVGRTPTLEETNSSIFNFFTPRGSSVKVEEISDVTQEAEFWISMNDPQRAIEILSAQEKVEQPDSPVPWLFLLDLYRTVKDQDKYNQLRDRFIVFFNANIPDYEADLSQVLDRHLEDYPQVSQMRCVKWG
jgi:pilus assembly protein FimV